MSVDVRLADASEMHVVSTIHGAAMRAISLSRFPVEDVERAVAFRCNEERWALMFTERNKCEIAVAVDCEVVIGFVQYGDSDDGDDVAEILRIFVSPESWGTGAGKALMDFALASLTTQHRPAVRLWSASTEQAQRFYGKSGFTRTGSEKDLELVEGVFTINVEFQRQL